MTTYPFLLADAQRLEAFALLGRPRGLFHDPAVWTDGDGVSWIAHEGAAVVIGVTSAGPGSFFDPQAPADHRRRSDGRRGGKKDGRAARAELADAVGRLRPGGHAERLLWAVHRAALAAGRSLLHLPDVHLGAAVWGEDRSCWPGDWRRVVGDVLRGLTWVHVAERGQGRPRFGAATALLYHAGDLAGADEDRCRPDCPCRGRHHHFQIDVGPGFLGVLEAFARAGPASGERTYDFPVDAPRKAGPSLRAVGKDGRLRSVYLPAKLGAPAACKKLSGRQHALLQALVRETTRAPKPPRPSMPPKRKGPHPLSEVEIFAGRAVTDYQNRKTTPCPLLRPEGRYVGFNGNGKRRGAGYRLLSPGGWLARVGYDLAEAESFLADLAVLADGLGLTAGGLLRREWFTLDQLRGMAARDRRRLGEVHLRVYAGADYLERWNAFFGRADASGGEGAAAPKEAVLALAGVLAAKRISLRAAAGELGTDPSFLGKVLRGVKPASDGLAGKIRDWLAKGAGAAPAPAAVQPPAAKAGASKARGVLATALCCLRRGWSVLPQRPGEKKPAVKWKPFQDRLPTEAELGTWLKTWPDAGLAVVLGPVSDLFVIDVDGREARDALLEHLGGEPAAPKAMSGSGDPCRFHLFFACPALPTKARATPWHPKLEFRGHRGIVVLPPSLHKSGNRYAWVPGRSPDDLAPPPAPPAVLDALRPVPRPRPAQEARAGRPPEGVDGGRRTMQFLSGACAQGPGWNGRLFAAACDLHGRGVPLGRAEPLLLAGARPWNRGEEESARRTIRSAYARPRAPAQF